MPRWKNCLWIPPALLISIVASTAGLAGAAETPTCSWSDGFHVRGFPATVEASVVFDDGTGPALYVGGDFATADDAIVHHVARWDGSGWSPVGGGVDGPVTALAIHDDGRGPALYAAGEQIDTSSGLEAYFLSRWDGEEWSSLSSPFDRPIRALASYDDGGGQALYAAGDFTSADGTPASRIARWDRSTWSAVGEGFRDSVRALAVFDAGEGPTLVAAGVFGHVAGWDGVSWSRVGGDFDARVSSLTVGHDPDGDTLYAGGLFSGGVARWDGAAWTSLGLDTVPGYGVGALAVFDSGDGPRLHAAGWFTFGEDRRRLARWDGVTWTPLEHDLDGAVETLTVFDDGAGSRLFAGGWFSRAGEIAVNRSAAWDGAAWSPIGRATATGSGVAFQVDALTVYDDGRGVALYAGGWFRTAGDVAASHVARWDGEHWTPLGGGTSSQVRALAVFDDGHGKALYAGGLFTYAGGLHVGRVAKWDGTAWSALAEGVAGSPGSSVAALAVFDDGGGPALYAGGDFDTASGVEAGGVARWDGAAWTAVGPGLDGSVAALQVFDDGDGPALYAGGRFALDGLPELQNVARWDGVTWTSIRSASSSVTYIPHRVDTLTVFDDGRGPALFAGGNFIYTDTETVLYRVARWDGDTWSALGTGTDAQVLDLVGFDDGEGRALYAAGGFSAAGGPDRHRVARWDGSTWSALGSGMDRSVAALAVYDAGGGPRLVAGGDFTIAGDRPAAHVVTYECFAPSFADGFETGDTSRWQGTVR